MVRVRVVQILMPNAQSHTCPLVPVPLTHHLIAPHHVTQPPPPHPLLLSGFASLRVVCLITLL